MEVRSAAFVAICSVVALAGRAGAEEPAAQEISTPPVVAAPAEPVPAAAAPTEPAAQEVWTAPPAASTETPAPPAPAAPVVEPVLPDMPAAVSGEEPDYVLPAVEAVPVPPPPSQVGMKMTKDPASDEVIGQKFYPSGELMSEFVYWKGRLDGRAKDFYKNGQVMYEWSYKKDRLNGTSRGYTMDGKLTALWRYKKGMKNGKFETFYPNGKTKSVEIYAADKLTYRRLYKESGKALSTEDLRPKKKKKK